jgi:hypothetical protein
VVDFYDVKKHGSGGRKGGRHGPHPRGMPDLMRQLGVIIREVIVLELVICTFCFYISQVLVGLALYSCIMKQALEI